MDTPWFRCLLRSRAFTQLVIDGHKHDGRETQCSVALPTHNGMLQVHCFRLDQQSARLKIRNMHHGKNKARFAQKKTFRINTLRL